MAVQPFTIAVASEVLEDLQQRLAGTRWPDEIPDSGWDYGSNLDYLKELVEYWRTEFDWRAQETFLKQAGQYRKDHGAIGALVCITRCAIRLGSQLVAGFTGLALTCTIHKVWLSRTAVAAFTPN